MDCESWGKNLNEDNPSATSTPRPAARILLIDQWDRLLLLHSVMMDAEEPDLWITVGGALEPGETYEQAALRQLWEETGLTGIELGPWLWNRRHLFKWRGQLQESIERFFRVRTEHFKIVPSALDRYEITELRGHEWWSVDDIQTAPAGSFVFVPRRLGELLPPLLAGDIPREPIDAGT